MKKKSPDSRKLSVAIEFNDHSETKKNIAILSVGFLALVLSFIAYAILSFSEISKTREQKVALPPTLKETMEDSGAEKHTARPISDELYKSMNDTAPASKTEKTAIPISQELLNSMNDAPSKKK